MADSSVRRISEPLVLLSHMDVNRDAKTKKKLVGREPLGSPSSASGWGNLSTMFLTELHGMRCWMAMEVWDSCSV